MGIPAAAVNEYMMTIANSNFEDWRRANPTADLADFPFNLKKMSVSGALFDMAKLTDVSKTVISKMTAQEVFDLAHAWADRHQPELAALFDSDPAYAVAVLSIDRGGKKPRKDIAKWSDLADYISYFYDQTFTPCYDLTGNANPALAVQVLGAVQRPGGHRRRQRHLVCQDQGVVPAGGLHPQCERIQAGPHSVQGPCRRCVYRDPSGAHRAHQHPGPARYTGFAGGKRPHKPD